VGSADYTALAEELPDVYREDAESFAQVESYLGLADQVQRDYVAALDDLTAWLSPLATGMWPPGLPADAGAAAVLDAQLAALDEAARWVGFSFPPSWTRDAAGLVKRRTFLLKAARLWRRRGTPRGFLDWFCLAFDITDPARRPFLIEHFKVGTPVSADGEPGPDPALRATLFVPAAGFPDYSHKREAIGFVERNAPAHVLMRVCWVGDDFADDVLGPIPAKDATKAELASFRENAQRLLCSLVSKVEHRDAVRIWTCIDEGRPIDRLGTGQLPGGGHLPDN
jgi:hypothetical protein